MELPDNRNAEPIVPASIDNQSSNDTFAARVKAVADASAIVILSVGSCITVNTFISEYAVHPDAMKESVTVLAPIVSAIIGLLVTKYKKKNSQNTN